MTETGQDGARCRGELKYHPNPRPDVPDPLDRCLVYLPPTGNVAAPYPVLYLLHGLGDTEYSWEIYGHLSSTMDDLNHDGQIDPLLVVMPFGFITQDLKLQRRFPGADAFAAYLRGMIATVEGQYPMIDGRRRALAGLSMGGKQALEYGLAHLDDFEAIGAFSAAIHDRGSGSPLAAMQRQVEAHALTGALGRLACFYASCGAEDNAGGETLREANRALMAMLERQPGINLHTEWMRGAHDWGVWKNSLRQFVSLWCRAARTSTQP